MNQIVLVDGCLNVADGEWLRLVSDYCTCCVSARRNVAGADLWPPLHRFAVIITQSMYHIVVAWCSYDSLHKQQSQISEESVACSLDSLLTSLPGVGGVTMTWIRDTPWPKPSEDVELFGVLKKLSCWYNAHMSLVTYGNQTASHDENQHIWARVLGAEVLSNQCTVAATPPPPLWSGCVLITSAQNEEDEIIRGVTFVPQTSSIPAIKSKENREQEKVDVCLYADHMTLVAMVDVRDIAHLYMSEDEYTVYISGEGKSREKSRAFLNLLHTEGNTGYILRVGYVRDEKKTVPSVKSDWITTVVNNPTSVYARPAHPPADYHGYHYLLVTSSGAVRLRTGRELCGGLNQSLLHVSRQHGSDCSEQQDLLLSVPCYRGDIWLQQYEKIQKCIVSVIQQWRVEHNSSLPLSLLHYINREVRRLLHDHVTQCEVKERAIHLSHLQPEWSQPCWEHLSLHSECTEGNSQAAHKLGGLSPPPRGIVLELSEGEFLRHFHPESGLPVKGNHKLRAVAKSKKGCKIPHEELTDSQWPQCALIKYHGVHYNIGRTPEKLALICARKMTDFQAWETESTCRPGTRQQTMVVKATSPKAKKRLNSDTAGDGVKKKLYAVSPRRTSKHTRTSSNKAPVTLQKSVAVKSVAGKSSSVTTASASNKPEKRSDRHKLKLSLACRQALELQGVTEKQDPQFYTACFHKLYDISYTLVKNLRGYKSLGEEMRKISAMQAPPVVYCERASRK